MKKGLAIRGGIVAAAGTLMAIGSMILGGLDGAFASTSDPVSSAFTSLQGNVTTYGAAAVALVVSVVVIFFGIKFLKRGASKA